MLDKTAPDYTQRTLSSGEVLTQSEIKQHIADYQRAAVARKELESDATLSRARRVELRKICRKGDDASLTIISSMARLAGVIVNETVDKRFGKSSGHDIIREELRSTAYINILEAALKYDDSRGPDFSTYAARQIRNSVRNIVADTTESSVKVVQSWSRMRRRAILERRQMQEDLGRTPTMSELKARMYDVCLEWGYNHLPPEAADKSDEEREDLAIRKVRKSGMLSAINRLDEVFITGLAPVLLDAPVNSTDGGSTFGEMLPEPDSADQVYRQVEHGALREVLNESFSKLSSREKDIIMLRWGFADGKPWAFRDIGQKFQISAERVRQIDEQARRTIRKDPNTAESLRAFLHPE